LAKANTIDTCIPRKPVSGSLKKDSEETKRVIRWKLQENPGIIALKLMRAFSVLAFLPLFKTLKSFPRIFVNRPVRTFSVYCSLSVCHGECKC
jgi:hypothetical protein